MLCHILNEEHWMITNDSVLNLASFEFVSQIIHVDVLSSKGNINGF